jgi:hypothetical protein
VQQEASATTRAARIVLHTPRHYPDWRWARGAPHAVLVPDAPNGPAAFVERSIGGLEAICGPRGRRRWASTYEALGLASLDLPYLVPWRREALHCLGHARNMPRTPGPSRGHSEWVSNEPLVRFSEGCHRSWSEPSPGSTGSNWRGAVFISVQHGRLEGRRGRIRCSQADGSMARLIWRLRECRARFGRCWFEDLAPRDRDGIDPVLNR